MSQVWLSQPGIYLDDFQYDEKKPTYYTEYLSYYILTIVRDLCNVGACLYTEDNTPDGQKSIVETFVSEFSAWLSECEGAVSGWLLESEESRGLPVLPAPPQISLALAGSVLLFKPAVAALAVDTVSSIVRVAQTAVANRRQAQVVRLLDKAFFRSTYWGLSQESIPAKILEALEQIAIQLRGDTQAGVTQGIASLLYDALTGFIPIEGTEDFEGVNVVKMLKKLIESKEIIRLLSHVVVSSGGNIDETEFTLAGTDIR